MKLLLAAIAAVTVAAQSGYYTPQNGFAQYQPSSTLATTTAMSTRTTSFGLPSTAQTAAKSSKLGGKAKGKKAKKGKRKGKRGKGKVRKKSTWQDPSVLEGKNCASTYMSFGNTITCADGSVWTDNAAGMVRRVSPAKKLPSTSATNMATVDAGAAATSAYTPATTTTVNSATSSTSTTPKTTASTSAASTSTTSSAVAPGWVLTPGGTSVRTIRSGNGQRPAEIDTVKVYYTGKHLDGKEFDSTKPGKPAEFGVNKLIKGVTEALLLMEVGGKYEVYVPSSQGYGAGGIPGVIAPNEDLFFEYELLSITPGTPEQPWVQTAGGTSVRAMKAGTGAFPKATDTVKVHYVGKHLDGKEFDSSFKRGKASEFQVDKLIKGVTEALQMMQVGGKYEVYVPASQAYGEGGVPGLIKPNEDIFFEYELIDIVSPYSSYPSSWTPRG